MQAPGESFIWLGGPRRSLLAADLYCTYAWACYDLQEMDINAIRSAREAALGASLEHPSIVKTLAHYTFASMTQVGAWVLSYCCTSCCQPLLGSGSTLTEAHMLGHGIR